MSEGHTSGVAEALELLRNEVQADATAITGLRDRLADECGQEIAVAAKRGDFDIARDLLDRLPRRQQHITESLGRLQAFANKIEALAKEWDGLTDGMPFAALAVVLEDEAAEEDAAAPFRGEQEAVAAEADPGAGDEDTAGTSPRVDRRMRWNHTEMELTMLAAIVNLGGHATIAAIQRHIQQTMRNPRIAELMQLHAGGVALWRTRKRLLDRREISGGRGVWAITTTGRQRVERECVNMRNGVTYHKKEEAHA